MKKARTRRVAQSTTALAAAALTLLASACGTSVSRDRLAAAAGGLDGNGQPLVAGQTSSAGTTGSAATTSPGGSDSPGTSTSTGSGSAGAGATGSSTGAAPSSTGSGTSSTSGGGGGTGGGTGSSSAGGTGSSSSSGTGSATTSGSASTGATPGSTSGTPCTKQLAPVVLGQTLATSGLVGGALGTQRGGLAFWAQGVNSRGGLQCHPVQLVQLDDGSDPARVASNVNELVDNKGAVALVGTAVPIANAALRSIAERKKIPVIGGDGITSDWYQSPWMFPQGGTNLAASQGGTITAAPVLKTKPKRAGLAYCVEAAACTQIRDGFAEGARKAGITAPVLLRPLSLTQSDFTAECQVMKEGGVDVMFLSVDGATAQRIARNCASLQYRPTFATIAVAISATSSVDVNLRANGTYLGGVVAPFLSDDTPGLKQFHADIKQFAGNQPVDQSTLQGYSSGMLVEAALAKVASQARSGPITTQMILDGLWQIKNETLGGVGPGVTFNKGRAATPRNCYFALGINKSGFVAPRGSKPQCI